MDKKKILEAVIKRGRKSKRGRPKKKVETKIVLKKKQDPFKITKQKGESAEAFKKRKASITKLRKQQEKELAKEKGTKLPSTKGRTEKSMTKPPLKKEMSKARRRRLVMQRLMGTNPKTGESKDIGDVRASTPELAMFSDATMTILTNKNNPVVECRFADVFPTSLSSLTYSQNQTDVEYLTASVTFKYKIYEIHTL